VFEFRVGATVAAADTGIFGVHEYIRANLQLIINAARCLDCESPGPGAADDLTGKIFRGQRLQRLAHRIDGERDRLRAFLVRRHVLRAAVVGLQPRKFQVRCIGDAACERCRIAARRHAAALHADFDLDQPPKRNAEIARHARCRVDLLGSIEAQRDGRLVGQRGQPPQLAFANHLMLTSTSFTPPRTSTSASPTFCTHWPTAPSAICRSAIAVDLWVLACGRTRTPAVRANSAIFAMLRSKALRSISSAGVSTSATGAPISAGGGFIRLRGVLWSLPYSMADRLVYEVASARDHPADGHERSKSPLRELRPRSRTLYTEPCRNTK